VSRISRAASAPAVGTARHRPADAAKPAPADSTASVMSAPARTLSSATQRATTVESRATIPSHRAQVRERAGGGEVDTTGSFR
jgi:hypothetical protein